ncbi:MAG: hypothetical protein JO264_07865 [Acidisphaera sp.]|nr:hypothetical protein [Acidisphaera sp.]
MKKVATFKQPSRPDPEALDQWVSPTSSGPQPKARPAASEGKPARLTIDLQSELHARFKAACAINKTRMIDEVRNFIKNWTEKHS